MTTHKYGTEFDAFISYSGSREIAKLIFSLLSRVGSSPWQFRKWWGLNIFIDKRQIRVGDDLPEKISDAIQNSRHFVLLALKAAAQSKWVSKELEFWLRSKPVSNILIVVQDGSIEWDEKQKDFDWNFTDCIPAVLKGKYEEECCWEDLRQVSPSTLTKASREKLRSAVASIGAKILDVSKDEILSAERTQHRRFWSTLGLVVLGLIVSIVVLAGYYQDRVSRIPADEAYNEGQTILAKRRNSNDIKNALKKFEQALKLNPKHVLAWLGKADAHTLLIGYGASKNPDDDLNQAQEALNNAKQHGATNMSEYYYIYGRILLYAKRDVLGARASLVRAVQLDSYNINALHSLASTYTFRRQHEEAIGLCRQALDIVFQHGDGEKDKRFILSKVMIAWTYYYAGEYELAERQCNEILDVDPANDQANRFLGNIYTVTHNYDKALKTYLKAGADRSVDRNFFANYTCALALAGQLPEAMENIKALLKPGSYVSPYRLAQCYASMGETKKAFEQLERARDERDPFVLWSAVDPLLSNLKGQAEFQTYLSTIGVGEV